MTDDQINIKIAETCGWSNCVTPHQDEYHFLSDAELGDAMGRTVGRRLPAGLHEPIPNYCNDLNAMHEAEMTLPLGRDRKQWDNSRAEFRSYLRLISGYFGSIHATARQRAEAFLRTIGKWEESE